MPSFCPHLFLGWFNFMLACSLPGGACLLMFLSDSFCHLKEPWRVLKGEYCGVGDAGRVFSVAPQMTSLSGVCVSPRLFLQACDIRLLCGTVNRDERQVFSLTEERIQEWTHRGFNKVICWRESESTPSGGPGQAA